MPPPKATAQLGAKPNIVAITWPTDHFTATFTFSEPVTGFTKDDVTVTNGTAGSFTGSGRLYTFGGALSSVIEMAGYEIWPELSFNYVRSWIEDCDLTGAADGPVDNTLSLDAGTVTLANIMFRPEFRWTV